MAGTGQAELDTILDFVRGLGIRVEIGPVPADTFLGGIRVRDGGLDIDPAGLLTPGDVLHEAGHLAVVPAGQRHRVGGDVDACIAEILAGQPADRPLPPALDALQQLGGELQAIAWSYAACRRLGLPLQTVFCPGAYGMPPDQSPMAIAQQLQIGAFPGIHWLARAGMTTAPPLMTPEPRGPGVFPDLAFWVQP